MNIGDRVVVIKGYQLASGLYIPKGAKGTVLIIGESPPNRYGEVKVDFDKSELPIWVSSQYLEVINSEVTTKLKKAK